jgi:AcrR family transcriptional regulator
MSMKRLDERGDLRVRRTHKLLWDALMAELAERSFEEITVKDICDRAMVHRTTFYKHYDDKYALLERGMRQMYDALVADEHAPPSVFSVDHPPPYFIRLFEHVAEHQGFYTAMLCGEGIGRFQKLVKDYIADVVEAKIRDSTPADRHLAVPPIMHVQFFAGGVLSLLAWWLENGMPYTPQQMAQHLMSIHFTGLFSNYG